MTGMRYKNVNLVIRTQKWMESVGSSVKENIKDSPNFIGIL